MNRLFRYMRAQRLTTRQRGFTVPELLVTMVAAGALIGLSLWLAHPKDYTAASNNATRWRDVSQIMQALSRYEHDTGTLPANLPSTATEIGSVGKRVNLCGDFVPKYMQDIPLDPTGGGQYAVVDCRGTAGSPGQYVTGYTIMRKNNTVTVAAPHAQDGKKISLTLPF
jgi:prepilin-type N-terminal cleavage/methylation domain-containing protein